MICRAIILCLACVLLAPQDFAAKPRTWDGRRIAVYDYTTTSRPYVEAMVAEFNAVLPRRAPRLVYHAMEPGGCGSHRRGIVVCDGPPYLGDREGATEQVFSGGEMFRARITLVTVVIPGGHGPANSVCHEFMHALSGIPDRYFSRENSCVHGLMDNPGAFDIAYLKRVYGKKRR